MIVVSTAAPTAEQRGKEGSFQGADDAVILAMAQGADECQYYPHWF